MAYTNLSTLTSKLSASLRPFVIANLFEILQIVIDDFGGLSVMKDYFSCITNYRGTGEFFRMCLYQTHRVDRETWDFSNITINKDGKLTDTCQIKLGHDLYKDRSGSYLVDIPKTRENDVQLNEDFRKEWKSTFLTDTKVENWSIIEAFEMIFNNHVYDKIVRADLRVEKLYPKIDDWVQSENSYHISPEAKAKIEKLVKEIVDIDD